MPLKKNSFRRQTCLISHAFRKSVLEKHQTSHIEILFSLTAMPQVIAAIQSFSKSPHFRPTFVLDYYHCFIFQILSKVSIVKHSQCR